MGLAQMINPGEAAGLLAGWRDPAEPDWLSALRRPAERAFAERGLPARRAERWRWSRLVAGIENWATAAQPGQVSAADLPAPMLEGSHRLVLVDGIHIPELSDDNAVFGGKIAVLGLRESLPLDQGALKPALHRYFGVGDLPRDGGLRALAAARWQDGAIVHLTPRIAADRPIELLFVSTRSATACHPQSILWLERGSRATVIERHVSLGNPDGLTNHHLRARIEPNARLRHYRLQEESPARHHMTHLDVECDSHSGYEGFALTTGAAASRFESSLRLAGAEADSRLDGCYLLGDDRHADFTSRIDHGAPRGVSNQTVTGILGDAAHGVFQGLIHVAPHAIHTDGRQLNRALLLSDRAEINSKPQLEIYADDVQCAHGATAGQLDEGALFYMRSRGIDRATARRLLMRAFIAEAIDTIADEAAREAIRSRAEAALEAL